MTAEHDRLDASEARRADWKRWGPYLAERAWGTVREDYSATGEAWKHFPYDHARSRAHHGMPVAALAPSLGCTLLVSHLGETIDYDGRECDPATPRWGDGTVAPRTENPSSRATCGSATGGVCQGLPAGVRRSSDSSLRPLAPAPPPTGRKRLRRHEVARLNPSAGAGPLRRNTRSASWTS